jgi:hypothetical protein
MTSIEKLFEDYKLVGMLTTAIFNHYQEMHKKEIIDAVDSNFTYSNNEYPTLGEQYYHKTFKKD